MNWDGRAAYIQVLLKLTMQGHISLHQTENPTNLKLYYTVQHQYFFQHSSGQRRKGFSGRQWTHLLLQQPYVPSVVLASGQLVATHTGFCILLSCTFEYFPITSNADTPFYIVKASRSDRMHQDKTNQSKDDSLSEGVCVPRGTGTSPWLTIHTAQRCVYSTVRSAQHWKYSQHSLNF